MTDMESPSESWDLIGTLHQGPVKTHGADKCVGQVCCVHNPSDHHMVRWPMMFDFGRGYLAFRVCEHGVPHPDPDSLAYMRRELGESAVLYLALHTCEGCCTEEGFIGAR